MTTQDIRSHAPTLAFGLSLVTIYAVAVAIVSRLGALENPDLVACGLTLDLTLLVPLLYYLLLARPRGWPAITVLPVFLASVLIAGRLIPAAQQRVLDLVSYVAALAELAIVAFIAHKALQVRRRFREQASTGKDVYESLREAARSVLGPVAGGALAYETAVFYYAVAGWGRSAEEDERSFSVHRNTAYVALMIAAILALVVETAAVHLLVRLWSPLAAWILTGISAYTLVWLIGDIHAVRLRRVRITEETLDLRIGLRWTVSIPLGSIRSVVTPSDDEPSAGREHLKSVLIGAPDRRIELTEPAYAVGLYGFTRRVRTIDLQLDEPARFDTALATAGSKK